LLRGGGSASFPVTVLSFSSLKLLPAYAIVLCWLGKVDFAGAADTLLQPNDMIALVGGEEMVAAAEAGEMELALITSAPELHLQFRSLAWEGDTVYEQRRDLNYPGLEQQLDQIGARVVMAQFGQMECLAGTAKLPAFVTAYGTLLDRLAGPSGRRLLLFLPHHFTAPVNASLPDLTLHNDDVDAYAAAIRELAGKRKAAVAEWTFSPASAVTELTRDGIHLNRWGEALSAQGVASSLLPMKRHSLIPARKTGAADELLRLIAEKNRLWFNYYRPQNWAFLGGDRTNQPSSRDYRDPSKRWFPEEMEQYLPMIESKQKEIWKKSEAVAQQEVAQ